MLTCQYVLVCCVIINSLRNDQIMTDQNLMAPYTIGCIITRLTIYKLTANYFLDIFTKQENI